jgi:hypothetical protein
VGTGPYLGPGIVKHQLALCDAGGPAADPARGRDADEIDGVKWVSLSGGNPKVLFINYRLAARRKSLGRALQKGEVTVCRAAAVVEYDGTLVVQARWKTLFKLKVQRQKAVQSAAVRPADLGQAPVANVPTSLQVWRVSDSVCEDEQRFDSPIPLVLVAAMKQHVGATSAKMDSFARDATKFTVTEAPVIAVSPSMNVWGCGSNLHNVCKIRLATSGILDICTAVQHGLSKYVDSLPKPLAKGADHIFRLSCVGPAGPLHTWVLLALPVFSPKVQCFVRCTPLGVELANGFSSESAQLPFTLKLLQCPARLSRGMDNPRQELWHETSDELSDRLCSASSGPWVLTPLEHRINESADSLLESVVGAEGESRDLIQTVVPNRADDAFYLWRRLSAPRDRASRSSPAEVPQASGAAAASAPAAVAPIEEVMEALGDESGASLLDVGIFDDSLQGQSRGGVDGHLEDWIGAMMQDYLCRHATGHGPRPARKHESLNVQINGIFDWAWGVCCPLSCSNVQKGGRLFARSGCDISILPVWVSHISGR